MIFISLLTSTCISHSHYIENLHLLKHCIAENFYDIEHKVTENDPENKGNRKQNSSAQSQRKRHVGAPDHGGYQRLIATGSIMATLGEENQHEPRDSIDVVFTTYWQYPAKVRIILPEDKACIEKYRKLHSSQPGKLCSEIFNTGFLHQENFYKEKLFYQTRG